MKKYIILPLLIFSLFFSSYPQPARAVLIAVDSINDAVMDTNQTNYWEAGIDLLLVPGEYEITPFAGAWTAWDATIPNFPGYKWNVFIYQESTQQKYQLGDWTVNYPTPQQAFDAYKGQSLLLTESQVGKKVWFFIEDGYPWDNSGSVTVSVNSVPEPTTMLLLGLGLMGLAGVRRKM